MLYRKFGNTGEEVSILGFGCMRLPVIDGDNTIIDYEKAVEMLRYAIDNGVNYIDTAYPYHGPGEGKAGESEPFVARALKDGYRERVKIATKLPSWLVRRREDMDRFLNEQLERLQTDHIDFYLMHALNKKIWANLKENGVGEFLDAAIADGRIRHAGFSFHDDIDTFKEIVDYYDWSFCQIQYNYLDEKNQAGTEGLEYAAGKGLGVTIMEPLRGGNLARKIPKEVYFAFGDAPVKRTPVQWAFRWLWNHPEVSVVLSGMSEIEQVVDNIKTASKGVADSLLQEELEVMERVKSVFAEKMKVGCTACRYCMPCPFGVDIPRIFEIYNNAFLFDDVDMAAMMYSVALSKESKASNCRECGRCERHCPQEIPIISELKKVRTAFEESEE